MTPQPIEGQAVAEGMEDIRRAPSEPPKPAPATGLTPGVAPAPQKRPSMFEMLACDTNADGSIGITFSALEGDRPKFWFEDKHGAILSVEQVTVSRTGSSGINLLGSTDTSTTWALTAPGAGAKLDKNFNANWALPEVDTFYLSGGFSDEAPPPTVALSDSVTGDLTPMRPDKAYRFSILMAVHRCDARVEVECFSESGVSTFKESRTVDSGSVGGTRESDYEKIVIDIDASPDSAFMKASITKEDSVEPKDDFIFFAKPCLVELPLDSGIRIVPRRILDLLKTNPKLDIYSANVPIPRELLSKKRTPVALVVAIGAESRRVNDIDVSWKSPVQIDHSWIENRDILFRGVRFQADGAELSLGVYVDGELDVAMPLEDMEGPIENRLSLSPRYLDGRAHEVEIRLLPGEFRLSRTYGMLACYVTPWEALQEYAKAPFSVTSSPAAAHHFRSYRAWMAHLDTRKLPQLSALNDELLQGFKKRSSYPPLEFPKVETPTVSIVIPVHNKFEVTYYCLCSLLFAYNDASFEVIVVDDGSSDATETIESVVSGLTVVRHPTALGFVDACNDGAAVARGEFIFFLNNDTEVTAGAIDALLKVFRDFDNVGLAGSKLLYPNGRLQEAGGIVWKTGNPWNVGRNQNPQEPQFNYLRQADYISGAAVMVPRTVWTEVGGFSPELAPAYFEDTDLAMKVRDGGRFVVYAPDSVIFHFEGQSAGTSTASGMKRFQEVNRPKFKRKWSRLYSRNGVEGVRPDLEKDRNASFRVLMLDYAFPQMDSDAGSYATFQEIRLLQSLGAKITFLPQNLAWLDRHTLALENAGVECLYAPFVTHVEDYIRDHAADYDVVYLNRFKIANQFVQDLRDHAPEAKIILNIVDLHFLRELREAVVGSPDYTIERAQHTRADELRTIESVDLTLTYSDVEAVVIQSHLMDAARVAKAPWVAEASDRPRPKFSNTKDILFLGGFAHDPNREAVKFFVNKVMPLLTAQIPEARFRVAGSRVPAEILALESENVEIVGFVRDLDELLESTRVYVAPLLAGAGIKGKVIEGMTRGVPSVLSPVAAEGTGLVDGVDCFIADNPQAWADSIAKLYTNEKLWNRIGDATKQAARDRFSFAAGQEMFRDALGLVDIFSSPNGLYYKWTRPRD